jgi:hypothetical protein
MSQPRGAKALIALAMVLSVAGGSAALAKEISAPEGCYLQIDREGTWICCPKRKAVICSQQPSRLPTRAF